MPTEILDYRGLNPAVTYNPGVRLSEPLIVFLNRLRDVLPADIPIHVNSGLRTPQEQAAAMLAKRAEADRQHAADVQAGKVPPRRDGLSELFAIYDDGVIRQLVNEPASTWGAMIEAMAARGVLVSPHLTGGSGALDFRIRDLSESDLATLTEAVRTLGATPLHETAPPHLHVQGIVKAVTTQGPPLRPVARVQGAGNGPGALLAALALSLIGASLTSGGST